jgi:hypothetical protein
MTLSVHKGYLKSLSELFLLWKRYFTGNVFGLILDDIFFLLWILLSLYSYQAYFYLRLNLQHLYYTFFISSI